MFTDRVTPVASATPVDRLVTGDAVEFEIRIARPGSRALALFVDIVVQVFLAMGLGIVMSAGVAALVATGLADAALYAAITTVLLAAVLVGYPTVIETMTSGRSIGKLAVGLRVVRDDGGPVRFRHALTRALVGVAVEWPGLVFPPVTWVASLWAMLASPQGKRLGDLAAGTIVIHERSPSTWGWTPGMPYGLAGWAASLDLAGLPDDLALAVRNYLSRYRQLREPARGRLGTALATEVAGCTAPPAPPGVPYHAYLSAVLAERSRRSAHRLWRARTATAALWPDLVQPVRPGMGAVGPAPPGPFRSPRVPAP